MTEKTRLGRIEISSKAIATIASEAVMECYGVVGISSQGLTEVLRHSHRHRGVKARFRDGAITIDIYVIMEYGIRITTVAHNVMKKVKFTVEKTLGAPVEQVNVHVQGLRASDADTQ